MTLTLFQDVYSNVWRLCFSLWCSTIWTRTRWISLHSEIFRDFMLHSNYKWSTELLDRCVDLNVPVCPNYSFHFNSFSVVDFKIIFFFLQIQRLPFLSSSNLALDTLRGSDESIGFEDILNGQDVILLNHYWHKRYIYIYFFKHCVCFLSSYRSSPEWSDGRTTRYGGIQTRTVVKKKKKQLTLWLKWLFFVYSG